MLGGDGLSFGDRRQIDAALATAKRFSDLTSRRTWVRRATTRGVRACPAQPSAASSGVGAGALRPARPGAGDRHRPRHPAVPDDPACRLAVATMTSSFLAGDLIGGLVRGIQQLGEAAHHPATLHAV